jgi:hypothetical protein
MVVFPEIGRSRLRRALLGYFCTNCDARLYLRQAANLLGEDVGNLSKELSRLEDIGIFKSTMSGKQKYYSLNKQYPLFGELKSVVFKTIGVEGALKEIVTSIPGITKSFVYGSFAREEEQALESKLQREINYTIYSPQEFARKKKVKGGFLSEVLKTKLIFLKGQLNA